MVTAKDLLNGASLRIVLYSDPGSAVDGPGTVTAYNLPHVLIDGEKFVGKTSNRLAPDPRFEPYDPKIAYSYAYPSFADIVVNCSQVTGHFRVTHRNAYREVRFVAVPTFRPIWEYGRTPNIVPVEAAVSEGRRLRIALLDGEGVWNIHPVHMPSFFVNKGVFELFTEQDAVPRFFRFSQSLVELESKLARQIASTVKTAEPAGSKGLDPITIGMAGADFYSCYYMVRASGQYLRGQTYHRLPTAPRYQALRVFAEV